MTDKTVLLFSGERKAELEERFWSKVEKTGSCWIWKGSENGEGYGFFHIDQGKMLAHRVAYEWAKGPIPEAMTLDHLCRNRACVNPDHLEPVTRRENILRGTSISAINSQKTRCLRGHLLAGDNLRVAIRKDGRSYRQCRICMNRRLRRYIEMKAMRKKGP